MSSRSKVSSTRTLLNPFSPLPLHQREICSETKTFCNYTAAVDDIYVLASFDNKQWTKFVYASGAKCTKWMKATKTNKSTKVAYLPGATNTNGWT